MTGEPTAVPPALPGRLPSGIGLGRLRCELPALLSFRLRQGERRRTGLAAAIAAAAVGVLLVLPVVIASGVRLDDEIRFTVGLVLPAAWAFFLVAITVSAVSSAGGRELLPRQQAQVFPISPATDLAGALILTPLNLAWILQAVALFAAVGVFVGGNAEAFARLWTVTLAWVVAATCVALLVGWLAELVRSLRGGTVALRVAALAAVAATVWVVGTDRTTLVLDNLPTAVIFNAALPNAPVWQPVGAVTAMLAAAIAAFLVAAPLVALVARRPVILQADLETRPVRRISDAGSVGGFLARLDRRLVARSAPLRRGLTILTALPFAAAALVPLPWTGIAILPALVASAAGLLYGVNAFALDGRGAVWRDSLPQPPGSWLDSRPDVRARVTAAVSGL